MNSTRRVSRRHPDRRSKLTPSTFHSARSSCPISSIPTELLSTIFLLYANDLWLTHPTEHHYSNLIRLTLVCRRWRTVVLDTALLWDVIFIESTTRVDMIKALLKLSKGSKLEFVHTSAKEQNGEARDENLKIAFIESHRFQVLALYSQPPKDNFDFAHLKSFTSLVSFYLDSKQYDAYPLLPSALATCTFPALELFHVLNYKIKAAGMIKAPKLRYLYISSSKIPTYEILMALSTFPNLEEVSCGTTIARKEIPSTESSMTLAKSELVKLSFLRHLWIYGTLEGCGELASHLTLPAYTMVNIHVSKDVKEQSVRPFLESITPLLADPKRIRKVRPFKTCAVFALENSVMVYMWHNLLPSVTKDRLHKFRPPSFSLSFPLSTSLSVTTLFQDLLGKLPGLTSVLSLSLNNIHSLEGRGKPEKEGWSALQQAMPNITGLTLSDSTNQEALAASFPSILSSRKHNQDNGHPFPKLCTLTLRSCAFRGPKATTRTFAFMPPFVSALYFSLLGRRTSGEKMERIILEDCKDMTDIDVNHLRELVPRVEVINYDDLGIGGGEGPSRKT